MGSNKALCHPLRLYNNGGVHATGICHWSICHVRPLEKPPAVNCLIDEDEEVNNPSHWFPNYTIQEFDDDIAELDQTLSIEGCMLISMSNSDLIRTKNLKEH